MIPDSFCKAPFASVVINSDGGLLPCCEYMQHKSTMPYYHISDFDQWWNHGLGTLRQRMIDDVVDSGCNHCRSKENNPQEFSLRLYTNEITLQSSQELITNQPDQNTVEHLEIRLGNICNLNCIMCFPGASSNIAAERVKHAQLFENIGISRHQDLEKDYAWYKNDQHWQKVLKLISTCRSLHVSGGEPFMNPRIHELLDTIPSNCRVSFNTNLTKIDEKIAQKLHGLKSVSLVGSLDGTGPHNEYVRWPSQWEVIEQAVADLDPITININHVMQHTSVYSIPGLVTWAEEKQLPITFGRVYTQSVFGDGTLTLNSVHPEDHLKFVSWLDTYNGQYKSVLQVWADSYVFSPQNHHDFRNYVRTLDTIRGTDFCAVFRPAWANP